MRELNQEMIDKIAKMLPPELGAAYLSMMMKLPNLPAHDEMLQILEVLQFFMIVAVQVPSLVTEEREKLESICADFIKTAKELETSGKDCYRDLCRRLTELKEELLKTINPSAIAALVAKDIERQFKLTVIPAVAIKLAEYSKMLEDDVQRFEQASKRLCGSLGSAAANASKAAEEMNASSSRAVLVIEQGIESFLRKFGKNYRRNMFVFCAAFMVLGFCFGILAMPLYKFYISHKTQTTEASTAQAIQQQPPINPVPKKNR